MRDKPVAEPQHTDGTTERFRVYQVQRLSDARVAAAAVMRDDLFPAIDQRIRTDLATIILELCTNIVKYAGSGRLLLRSKRKQEQAGLEILAIDEGPGIPDIQQALQDHFTTGGSLGLGLGLVQRLAHSFDLNCPATGGTRVRAVCWWSSSDSCSDPYSNPSREPATPRLSTRPAATTMAAHQEQPLQLTSHSRNRAALHQEHSGDALLLLEHGPLGLRIVIDGAGHGSAAHALSSRAAAAIRRSLAKQFAELPLDADNDLSLSGTGIDALMLAASEEAHQEIRGSRGVALGMAVFDRHAHRLHFLGIGNTRILLLRWKGWEGVSRDGQLGVSYKHPRIQHFDLQPDDVILQSSDGIRTSTLRAMRPKNHATVHDLKQVADQLLARTSHDDDVSILLTRCHV